MGATASEIKCITGTTKADADLDCFITAADQKVAKVALCNPSLSVTELDTIANWYASYLLAAGGSDQALNVTSEKIEQYEKKFGGSSETVAKRLWTAANGLSGGCIRAVERQKAQIGFL